MVAKAPKIVGSGKGTEPLINKIGRHTLCYGALVLGLVWIGCEGPGDLNRCAQLQPHN